MINTKYQGCANQYLHFARDVSSELARTITRRTFSCLTFYDGSKDPAVSHAPSRKISTTNIDNKINDLPTHCSWKPITPDLNTMASILYYQIHLELKCWLDVL